MKESSRLSNRVLIALSAGLLVYVFSCVVLAVANMPLYYQRVISGTVPMIALGDQIQMSNALIMQRAVARGMTLPIYAAYSIVLHLIITLGFVAAATLIALRARGHWFRWFTAFVLIFYPTGGLWQFVQAGQLGYRYLTIGSILWPSYLLFLYLFPNGRAAPRWTRWLVAPILLLHLGLQFVGVVATLQGKPIDDRLIAVFMVVLAGFPIILGCQVFRYLRVSSPVERAQTKWFVAGFALFFVIGEIVRAITQSVLLADDSGFVTDLNNLSALFIPASLVIAILRYRLWDIDVIINRALVYAALTGTLAVVYLGLVVVLQQLVRALTGDTQSEVVTVISTLAIAALFQPLRRRLQQIIDRRFYRRKYDAAKMLEAFSARLRAETDLEQLRDDTLAVVQEALEPAHVSLWLRERHRT